jgi:hypothetical protein
MGKLLQELEQFYSHLSQFVDFLSGNESIAIYLTFSMVA